MADSSSELSDLLSSLPYSYDASNNSKEIKEDYDGFAGKQVSVAGRITAVRKSGKLLFADLLDGVGKIQAYFDFSTIGEERFNEAKKFNSGDIIGVKGEIFKTKAGEVSIRVKEYALLSKAMLNLPDKWHGLQDVETRYRQRHLDLIMNPEIKEVFRKRSMTLSLIRRFLDERGFMEFETPTIQPLYGGADAQPFKVFVNTLNEEHYMRISDELYLKRLIIGGFERVYEIYKAFRNEDIDSTHSPEFTIIEWYQAYADYNEMMKLLEGLLQYIAKSIFNSTEIKYQDVAINLKAPFKRINYLDSISKGAGIDVVKAPEAELLKFAEGKGIRFEKGKRTRVHAYDKLFDMFVKPGLMQPTFVIDYPRESSPLTRAKRGNPELTERFEFYAGAMELANSYSELNNPVIQRENFEYETKKAKEGDKEAEPLDLDFVEAMEHGMPPTGGLGLGIDRLVMLLTDKASIKEVILFPMEKRLK